MSFLQQFILLEKIHYFIPMSQPLLQAASCMKESWMANDIVHLTIRFFFIRNVILSDMFFLESFQIHGLFFLSVRQ
ncbi:hypothetical protein GW17_00048046 [Ensete ventricosum]|nr:hypothetical protein GW17_00048046 [Ensete ventricosum]